MPVNQVFQRQENKFLMDKEVMRKILPQIESHMTADAYCQNGRSYRISNLYYDTEGHDVIRESLQKPYYKEKLRMRCYGIPSSDKTEVFLEMKKKVGGIVTKRRANLTYKEAQQFLKDRIYPKEMTYLTEQVLHEIEYYLSCKDVAATTRLSYDRRAYFDKESSDFRLTIDENIRFLTRGKDEKEIRFHDSRKGERLLPENLRLMEVKVRDAYPLWFTRILQEKGIYPVSFSKYGVAYKTELIEKLKIKSKYIDILSHI